MNPKRGYISTSPEDIQKKKAGDKVPLFETLIYHLWIGATGYVLLIYIDLPRCVKQRIR